MITDCMLCLEEKECRYIDLYIIGSEGLQVCHSCEMKLVEYARSLRSKQSIKRMEEYKKKKTLDIST